jgi:hypothetical protein
MNDELPPEDSTAKATIAFILLILCFFIMWMAA